ncbi:transposase [Dyella sp. M7H15-1]|uniref:transposase n=1 Tax=Dyella sp. M7H15-1 TaxID=2501295 RepID=UPI0013E8E2A2|nr:transposase [Dyella sp. M7H15-1]
MNVTATPMKVRGVRHVASAGRVRVLMTTLFDRSLFPAKAFGDLYHPRWRIEEAFKRLKHRLHLEHVSGLSQLAVIQDLDAKVMCDNLHALVTAKAHKEAHFPEKRRINRSYATTAFRSVLSAILLGMTSATVSVTHISTP